MDIDRYIQRNEPEWDHLVDLSKRGSRSIKKLTDAEIDELIHLYQLVSAQLSHVRTTYEDPHLNARLSQILGEARAVIYRGRTHPLTAVAKFFTVTFPAAVWHSRYFVLLSTAMFFVPALLLGFWLAGDPDSLERVVPADLQAEIAESQFADYYKSDSAQNFATSVTLNNARVGLMAFAFGFIPMLGTGFVMVFNGANVGVMGAVMHSSGESAQFWGLILPHGLLEIAAILVAGGAGLRLSWTIIAPGDRTRLRALKEEGLRSISIVFGLVVCFIVAGFIEGFVTPSDLPTSLRIAVGVSALVLFTVYLVALGSQAARQGVTGLPGEQSTPARNQSLLFNESDDQIRLLPLASK